MEKKSYIVNRFKNILNETLNKRAEEVLEKLNLNKETPFRKPGMSADYVEEGEVCEVCGGYKGGEMAEGEKCECGSMNEEKHNKFKDEREKIDVAEPYGKITKDDFEKLRKGVKKHMEEKECMECGSMEEETSEGNEFTGALAKAKERGDDDFMVNGKRYKVREGSEKFIQKATKGMEKKGTEGKLGSWCKRHGLASEDGEVTKKCIDKAMKSDDSAVVKMANFAKNIGGFHGAKHKKKVDENYYRVNVDGEFAIFTEEEMISLIENIVKEEKVKSNIKNSTIPKGMSEYERVHKADKKEEDQYFKDLAKKMKDYTKNMEDEGSKYEMKGTKKFPTENGGLKKGIRKKYTPSDAVDDYNDAFSYPGQTNLRFDEIKPTKKNIEKYLKGDSTTGNAQVDKDGNALGNVVPSEVGEKFYKNFEENLYGQEQADASYKRYSQPVDLEGENTLKGSLKDKRGKGKKTAQSVLNKLEENVNEKENKKLNEEFDRIQSLMGYNRKTQ
jgi:hypothetical protein